MLRVFTGFAGVMLLVYAGVAASAAEPAAQGKPDIAHGRQIASTVCVACHGADGNSVVPANPVLAGQGADYIAAQLAAFKSGARPNPIMQGMAAGLSPEDMRDVAAWFASQKQTPRVAHDEALALRGQKIWRGGIADERVPACAGCHGATGKGVPSQFPRLAGQFPGLTLAWLKAFASGTRPNPVMQMVAAHLSEADMKAVAEYAAGLR